MRRWLRSRVPSCCGMPMAYSGAWGFYCLRCGKRG